MCWIRRGMCCAIALLGACSKEDGPPPAKQARAAHESSKPSQAAVAPKPSLPAAAPMPAQTLPPLPPPSRRPPSRPIAGQTAARAHFGKLEVLYAPPRTWQNRSRSPGVRPAHVCSDGRRLYWSTPVSINGVSRLWTLSLGGGQVSMFAQGKGLGFVIACHGGKVFGNRGFELIEHLGQGRTRTVTTGKENPLEVVFAGQHVYFNSFKTPDIWRAPIAGGKVQRFARSPRPSILLADGGAIYWTDYKAGTVNRVDIATGQKTVLARGQQRPIALASDRTHIYWGEERPGTIKRISKGGGAVTELIRGAINHDEIAVHGGYVYWRSWGTRQSPNAHPSQVGPSQHHVSRVPVTGGAAELVISNMQMPENLQIDRNRLLVINKGEGALLSLMLP